jgi:hypothetical protein
MYVLHSRSSDDFMRDSGVPHQSLLDCETTWPTIKFLHLSIWRDWRL